MRRDPRSFVAVRWTLIEGVVGANLAREARGWLGFSPALGFNAVAGIHFRTRTGRAVAFSHPPEPHESLVGMGKTLISTKHGVAEVECVDVAALPAFIQSARRKLNPDPGVSLWPAERSAMDEPVVVEYVAGGYLPRAALNSYPLWSPPTFTLAEAAVFAGAEEARDWLDHREVQEQVTLSYLSVARAHQDRLDAALSP